MLNKKNEYLYSHYCNEQVAVFSVQDGRLFSIQDKVAVW